MSDMISRTAAIEYLMTNMGWHDEDGYEVDDADEKRAIIADLVNGIPAVDAVPVVHGLWIYFNGVGNKRYQCSECFHWVDAGSDRNYCPNCGAKMDRGEQDG